MKSKLLALTALIPLAGCAPDAAFTVFEGTELTGNVTWSGTVEVRNSFDVRGTLTLARCTKVLLPSGGVVSVRGNGALKAEGTADCPVVMQSVKASPAAGDWSRIDIYADASNDSRLTHTRILHGDGTSYGVLWVDSRASVGLDDVTFEGSKATSVRLEREARLNSFSNVKFVKTNRALVSADADLVGSLTPMTATETPEARVLVTGDVTRAATWKNLGVPVELPSMAVRGGALEVEAGSVLKAGPEAVISVSEGGGLRLLGTASAPVTLESAKSSPAAGDWRRIDLYASSLANNLLRHVTVRHGGDSSYGVLWLETGATVALESTSFSSNSSCEVGVDGTVNDTGSTFVRCQ